MTELIKVKNTSYARYEELLMRRDQLKKEAFLYERTYVRTFGDKILVIFQKKIECIRKKKTIEFCQAAANRGNAVDQNQLQAFLSAELECFEKQLKDMLSDLESAKNSEKITELDLLQIKKIYRKLVKLIHPDVNPMVADSPELMELWARVLLAYNHNALKDLQELEVLVITAIEQLGIKELEIEIPNLDEKIEDLEAEIKQIRETDPYMYKFLLENPDAVKVKEEELEDELKSYEDYSAQLDEILKDLLEGGVGFTWQMN